MKNIMRFPLALVFTISAHVVRADAALTVSFQQKEVAFTAEQFAALSHADFAAVEPKSKAEHHYRGVEVHSLLAQVTVPFGKDLHGTALHYVVLVQAVDGYSVAFTLADFDETFSDLKIWLVDQEDGKPLAEKSGPLRLVVPGDKKPARWVREVGKIRVIDPESKP